MLAAAAPALPVGAEWRFEPKMDGFRTLLIVDDAGVRIVSARASVGRSVPRAAGPRAGRRLVLDGETVVMGDVGPTSGCCPAACRAASTRQ